jgi:predicted RNA-binding Zn ribbon-like protein
MRLRGSHGSFTPDCVALDFLNSGEIPGAHFADGIASGKSMLSWIGQTKIVPRALLLQVRRNSEPQALDRVAARVRELRRWLRDLVSRGRGRSLEGVDIAAFQFLNCILTEDKRHPQIVALGRRDSTSSLQLTRDWRNPDSLLWAIAEIVAKLICEEDFGQIKVCSGCGLFFLDRTRRQIRKWCSMSACGNRAKQAAHRKRSRRRRP